MKVLYLLMVVISLVSSRDIGTTNHGSDYKIVPGGRVIHDDCVHNIPSRAFLIENDASSGGFYVLTKEGDRLSFPKCPHDPVPYHGPAWKAWTQYENPSKITSLYGEWQVPPAPPSYLGQILYFWNGIEPEDNSAVLQPVLQYGQTPAGGGSYWGIASWYVSDTDSFSTQVMSLVPGDIVTGENKYLNNGSWVITGSKKDDTTDFVSFTYTPPSADYTWAYQVLEAYTILNCQADYPNTGKIIFDNIVVEVAGSTVTPTWQIMTKDPLCNENAGIQSPAQVSIMWN